MALYNNLDTLPEGIQNLLMDELLHTDVEGINVTDGEGNVLYINDAHHLITGHNRSMYFNSDGSGKNMQELIDKGVVSNSASLIVLKSGKAADVRQSSSAGKTFNIHAVPIRDKSGKIVLVLNQLTDLTEYVKMQRQVSDISHRRKSVSGPHPIEYQSPAMRELIDKATLVADTDVPILVSGPSGSGKPDVAAYVHNESKRSDMPFLSINCSAAPERLLEAELFGYVPGAVSGGEFGGKIGLMEQASGGTLFLDGIGDMPKSVQARLLTVLREKEFTRIGGGSIIPVDFRLIAETNLNLRKECEEGRFLIDLFYELTVIELKVPPLKDCREDIPLIAEDLLNTFNTKYSRRKTIGLEALRALTQNDWPGNRRELRNVMERLVIQGGNQMISGKDVIEALGIMGTDAAEKSISAIDLMPGASFGEMMEAHEKLLLEEFCKLYRTESEIAERLGMNQSTVSRKLKKYGLKI